MIQSFTTNINVNAAATYTFFVKEKKDKLGLEKQRVCPF